VTTVYCLWVLGVATGAAGRLTGEREEDTWISLISTPLTPVEIVRAKMLGALWATRWIGLIWGALIVLGVTLGGLHPIGAVAVTIATGAYLAFACALGTFFSARSKSSARAVTATVASMIAFNGGYLFAAAPVLAILRPMRTFIFLAGVTPLVEVFSLLSYSDVRAFPSPWRSGESVLDGIATYLLSIVTYLGVAGLLSWDALRNFDDVNGRPPQRAGGERRELEILDEDDDATSRDEADPSGEEEPLGSRSA
jgi:hypothetical protein